MDSSLTPGSPTPHPLTGDNAPWAPHRSSIKVRFVEIDPYGHVNHSVYLTYFEVARTEALEAVGLPLHELAESGFQLVITDLSVRYRRAARLGQTLTVETSVSETRRASAVWSQRVLDDEGNLCVEATVKAGVCDSAGKPTRAPAWLFERTAALVPPAADAAS